MKIVMAGVQYIDIHTHQEGQGEEVLSVINPMPGDLPAGLKDESLYSVGFHPWEIKPDMTPSGMFGRIEPYLRSNNVVMIGETGIDRSLAIPVEIQKELFTMHAKAAENLQKPLIIHAVRSFPELISIRKSMKPAMPWIIHGFRSNPTTLKQLVRHGFYISFGPSAFRDEERFGELTRLLPLSAMLLETDDSREDIRKVYEKAAMLMGMDLNRLKDQVSRNFEKLPGI